ncbi:ABC transporter substrate-binding protein [Paenibacillus sp. GCM10027627]|uniref:ABC transporter substrate-binding protein n=1 Tax=unclassified Paenibacillus TaxID=185978 RepID=UPI00362A42C7
MRGETEVRKRGIQTNKSKWWMIITLALSLILAGCSSSTNDEHAEHGGVPLASESASSEATATPASESKPYLTFKDHTDQQVVLEKKPEKLVILNTEVVELLYQLGGTAAGIATAPGTPVPEAAKGAKQVGLINEVSIERIVSLKPDLVIGQSFFHAGLRETLASNGIPLALTKLDSYDSIQETGKLLGQIIGKESETEKMLKETDEKVQTIVNKAPDRSYKYAMISMMSMGISLEKSGNIALDIAGRLKISNVAESMESGPKPDAVPYSLEKLVEADPDYLFLLVYGTEELGKQMLEKDLASNPAWSSLQAVKENNVFFLTSEFVNTSGLEIDKTFEHFGKLVYPDVFK